MGRQVLTPWIWIAMAAMGCRSELNPAYCAAHADPRCGDGGSNGGDSSSANCFGAGNYKICLDTLPTSSLNITTTIDTTPGASLCAAAQPAGWIEAGQPQACFVIAKSITVMGGNASATGPRPLVLLGTESLNIDDDLALSGKNNQATPVPAGFDPAACTTAATPATDSGGASGGAGGSFGTKGGDGGAGIAANPIQPAHDAVAMPVVLHGGCPGQNGGVGSDPMVAPGGNGGGAVFLVSHALTLGAAAKVTVNGAGGSNGGHHAGGGGAGAGGMIVLYADMFTISTGAMLIANGGGGASGGDSGSGARGDDPSTSNPTSIALGATSAGGHGGNGYAGGVAATSGQPASMSGGGGGGGGGGFIVANQQLTGVAASPAPMMITF